MFEICTRSRLRFSQLTGQPADVAAGIVCSVFMAECAAQLAQMFPYNVGQRVDIIAAVVSRNRVAGNPRLSEICLDHC
jgi:hypothetical protein